MPDIDEKTDKKHLRSFCKYKWLPCVLGYVMCCEHAILPFNENSTFTFSREYTADGELMRNR